ncbi:hypothetical protein [Massilia genomosp. 1]|uniref:Lipoprotein SmpA/OmlA domain-containing protein n=1 Tax=Massilia genomosp. 1 TaxID=2609280 RepID=A0ABX0N1N1_9BURK|nr:hypothetical protein [Massilia genomosp. 1]NHZ65960.1 hypothetical protein [Massilia genomosp. 1]
MNMKFNIPKSSLLATLALYFSYMFMPVMAMQNPSEFGESKKILDAQEVVFIEKIAIAGFKKHTNNRVKNFSWRYLYSDTEEYVFTFEDLDVIPRPGSDYFVIVKRSGKIIVTRGR